MHACRHACMHTYIHTYIHDMFIFSKNAFSESQLVSLWPILLDMDKLLFVNEKFLSTASDEGNCFIP